ncbi:MAG: endonuclease/exonuclease/phosphatase family protein [Candidatus Eremiobacteraeota bacterium]|nr:endonuclease/exonuclease/phosphatase family protein [Candidatus Eremiobacteraeota bacterium]MCW5867958.1 endonuclease/exonuclease/phosphatase family protein [Candidatus Eremiobacteraeota bacterium]
MGMLTVLTQNLRIDVASDRHNDWTHRRPLMEKLLQDYQADVIAFQEVFENQRRDLIAMLPGYAWHGRGREPDETGEGCYVFWNSQRVQAVAQETFFLAPDPNQPGLAWDAACPRICNRVVLKSEEFPVFQLYNVHLDHLGKVARQKSAELVRAHMARSQEPAILLGDFNQPELFEQLPCLQGLQDAFVIHGADGTGTFHGFTGHPQSSPIDYILTTSEFSVDFCQLLTDHWDDRYPSDHFGLLAGFEFAY